ncbi:MAG TPA: hypothetical protein VGM62_11475 [Chthoniobacterales bacterium]
MLGQVVKRQTDLVEESTILSDRDGSGGIVRERITHEIAEDVDVKRVIKREMDFVSAV